MIAKHNLSSVVMLGFSFLASFSNAQFGNKLESFPINYFDQAVRHITLYERSFLVCTKTSEVHKDIKTQYFFLNGDLVQTKMDSTEKGISFEKLGTNGRQLIWELAFEDEKIKEVENNDYFHASYGENGGLLLFGKGRNKGVVLKQSAKMSYIQDKWLQKTLQRNNTSTVSDSQNLTKIKIGGKLKPLYNSSGSQRGYISDKGLIFDNNGYYEGWTGK